MYDDCTPPEELGLVELLREDRVRNGRSILKPGFQALATHRFGVYEQKLPRVARLLTSPIYKTLHNFVRNFYGIEIERTVRIGRRLLIGHQSGIVVHPFATIGNNVLLRQNTTLGGVSADHERWLTEGPVLEDGVSVGAGAMIMGRITVGQGARIGPNVVVTRNVPANAVVVATPPRVIRPRAASASEDDSGTAGS